MRINRPRCSLGCKLAIAQGTKYSVGARIPHRKSTFDGLILGHAHAGPRSTFLPYNNNILILDFLVFNPGDLYNNNNNDDFCTFCIA